LTAPARTLLLILSAAVISASVGAAVAPVLFRTPRFVSAMGAAAQPVVIPEVAGMSRQDARREIESAGLVLAGEWSEYGPVETAGQVTRQDPPPGTQVPRGSPVSVFWNVGPLFRPYHPGQLPGLPATEAEEIIAEWQLYTAGRSRIPHPVVPEGRVIAACPPVGESLAVLTPVRLLVSTGWTGVPLLAGMRAVEADSICASHGLVMISGPPVQTGEACEDSLVASQIPAPGTPYEEGDTVSVVIYRSTPLTVLPDTGQGGGQGWGQW
jgi:serine/threonine-protein kinase